MNFKILPVQAFLKELKHLSKKYPSIRDDLARLGQDLILNPKLGTPVGKNCYKVRLQITSKGKGKSGGARVITHLLVSFEKEALYLLKIYDKATKKALAISSWQTCSNLFPTTNNGSGVRALSFAFAPVKENWGTSS